MENNENYPLKNRISRRVSRQCSKCGKLHNMVVEEVDTGKIISLVTLCSDCLFENCIYPKEDDEMDKR